MATALQRSQASPPADIACLLITWGKDCQEIVELTWDRVDLRRGFILLRAVDTKTKQRREVPLTPAVKATLQQLAKVRRLETSRVFLYKDKPIQRISRAFKSALKDSGLQDFRFHDLRHCASTNLRRAGMDTATAMQDHRAQVGEDVEAIQRNRGTGLDASRCKVG